jgi:hypothetical protein
MNGSDKAPTAAHVAVDLRESVAHEGSWWLAPGEYVHER